MSMMYILTRILLNALALLAAAYLIPGIEVEGAYVAVIAAIILGLMNLTLKPLLLLLTLPITILTLGLFAFVINAFVFLFVASFVEGFSVEGFVPAFLGSLVVSIVSAVGSKFLS